MKKLFLLVILMAGFTMLNAQTAQTIPGSIDLANGTLDTSTGKVEDGTLWDSKHGTNITFLLSNATAQEYTVTFEAASKKDGVKAVFTIMDGETEICQKEVAVNNTGNWGTYETVKCYLPELPASSSLTMNMKLLSTGGNYTANVRNLAVAVKTAQDKEDENKEEEKEEIVNQIPTDDANPFVLTAAEISGTGTAKNDVENGNLDSFKNGATATFKVNCTKEGTYKVAFAAGSKTGASLHFAFFAAGSETAELEKDVVVEGTGGWSWFDVEAPLGQLTVGEKTLVITFTAAEGQTWTTNMKDVKFTIDTNTGINGITVKGISNDVYTIDGKAVAPSKAKRGLYIIDGKKVVK